MSSAQMNLLRQVVGSLHEVTVDAITELKAHEFLK